MSSEIRASDIRNIHIYNGTTHPRELKLCKEHRADLSNLMADKIDKLVSTKLFQSEFKDFLPDPNQEVHVRIRITDRKIIVQKVDKSGSNIVQSKEVKLTRGPKHNDKAKEISQSILKGASRIYQRHLNEASRQERSISPLYRRATRHDSERGRRKRDCSHNHQRSTSRSSEEQFNRRKPSVRSLSSSPDPAERHSRRDRHSNHERSTYGSPDERQSYRRRDEKPAVRSPSPSPTPTERHSRNKVVLQTDFNLHQPKAKTTAKRESGTDHRVYEQLSNMDQRVKNLEEKLRSTSLPPAIPLHPEVQSEAPSSEELNKVKSHTRDLKQRLQELRAENQFLKTELPKITSSTSSADFNKLIQLSRDLSSAKVSFSACFPQALKEEFMKLPEMIRYAIYYHTYLLVDPSESLDPWPIGQKLFEDSARSDKAINLCRAHAIRHFLMHTLANDFAKITEKTPPLDFLERFNQLPEEDKSAVYKQLELIQPPGGPHHQGPAYAFVDSGIFSATNQERAIAINRVIFDRIAEYHRHHYRQQIETMWKIFQEACENLKRDPQPT